MANKKAKYVITNSERATAACPQKWLLRYGLGLRPVGRIRVFDLGSLVHAGLEHYFGTPNLQRSETDLERALSAIDAYRLAMTKQALESANLSESGAGSYIDPALIDGLAEDAATAKRLVASYHEFWNPMHTEGEEWEVIAVEGTYSAQISNTDGKRLNGIDFAGKVDMVVKYHDRIFIVEHKTTAGSATEWIEKNRRNPQTRSYAWLLRQNGIDVDGVIYDIIQSKPPKLASELPRLKDGTRLAKTTGLPWTNADEFYKAIHMNGGNMDSAEWYYDTWLELNKRDALGFWFNRYTELFDESEITRVQSEIYQSALQMRKWKQVSDKWHLYRNGHIAGENVQIWAERTLALPEADTFVRQSAMCWQYNRLCEYAALCSTHNRLDAYGFTVAANGGHTELNLAERKK